MPGHQTVPSEKVLDDERKRIESLRPDSLKGRPLWGLAHSGGGIRSASFSIGVLQALHRFDKLRGIDYLSTVSGGGYSGGSLTWFLRRSGKEGGSDCRFPFGRIGAGQRTDGKDNRELDFIRQHARYLTPGGRLDMMSLVGVALRSMFVTLLVYGALMVLIWLVLVRAGLDLPPGDGRGWIPWPPGWPAPATGALALAYGLAGLLVVFAALYSVSSFAPMIRRYSWSLRDQALIGMLWKVFGLLAVVGSVPWAKAMVGDLLMATAAPSVGVGSLLGLLQYRARHEGGGEPGGTMARVRPMVAVVLTLYGLLLLSYAAAEWIVGQPAAWWWVALVAGVAVLVGGLANLNHSGLHRMYRDRLMETFMPDPASVDDGEWRPAREADKALIQDMCRSCRPYHLVNTNVVLIDSAMPRYRGRGGDSFILSPLFCGSDATGWVPSGTFNQGLGNRGMTLSTAVAISGAAVNPGTGVAGSGPTRDRLVSALMTLLNLRLGYWAVNPNRKRGPLAPANYLWPGIRGLLGMRLSEASRVIELTDGGHFENLALYELIRRKVKVIIVADGGADPDFQFADLANAIERVRVDFGAVIRFRPEYGIEGLIPGSGKDPGPLEPGQLAERGFAVADIRYHDDQTGKLVYLKTTVTSGLPADVYGYKKANPAFPDQPTSDQFFDEAQFEAYRELGYQLAKAMIRRGILDPSFLAEPAEDQAGAGEG